MTDYVTPRGWFKRLQGATPDLLVTECAIYFFHIAEAIKTGAIDVHVTFTSGSDNLEIYYHALTRCGVFTQKYNWPLTKPELTLTLYGAWISFIYKRNEFKALDLLKLRIYEAS